MYRRAGRGRVVLLVFLALSIVIITLDFRQGPDGALEQAKDVSATIVAPIQRGATAIVRPIGNFFSSLGELSSLRAENSRLQAENEALRGEIKEAESIEDENVRLSELLDLEPSWATGDRVAAAVYGVPPSNYKWARFVDAGASDGVKRDMAVVSTDGLVGKVLSVQADSSIVLLLVDPEAGAGARLQREGATTGPTGIIEGNGGDQPLSLDGIATAKDVEVGDEVVTSGYDGGIFPPDIPIGTVSEVGGETSGLHKEIAVEPYVDFTTLSYVYILLDTGPKMPARPERGRGK